MDFSWLTGRRKEIPRCSLIEGFPCEERSVICKETIIRRSQYTFEYSNELYIITGIACRPASEEIQSPEPEVVRGGVNYSCVAIHLTPLEEELYACQITITGIERQPHRRNRWVSERLHCLLL